MPAETLYFVHLTDSHIGPTPAFSRHGHRSYSCARRAVDIINSLPVRPDFVMHTGDVVTAPDPRSYALAAELFAGLEPPVYYATGNHDTASDIRAWLPMGPHEPLLDDPAFLCYRFHVKGYRLVVLDARAPDELDPHGLMPASQLAYLHQEARETDGPPLVVFLHFPVLPLNAPWMDANMRLINWEETHAAFAGIGPRLRAVCHGHVHQNMQTSRDGVLYVAAASTFSQFAAWPTDEDVCLDPDHLPGFNFVHLLPHQTIIHQHTFPRPQP